MFRTIDGTTSVTVSGPSPRLAMLRAVILKARRVASALWSRARMALGLIAQTPVTVASTAMTVLAGDPGYRLATQAARSLLVRAWNRIGTAARLLHRLIGRTVHAAITLVGYASASGADLLYRHATDSADRIAVVGRGIDQRVRTFGQAVWLLINTTLVRTATTTTAGLAAGLFAVHTLTQGVLAARIVAAVPALMTAVVWATSPWLALAGVGGVATAATMTAFLLIRPWSHRHTTAQSPATRETGDSSPTTPEAAPAVEEPEKLGDAVDLASVAAGVRIEVTNDGSVIVHGIPDTVPEQLRQRVAEVASQAALGQWRRIRPVRPCPSRNDRRLFTKVARDALRAQARRNNAVMPTVA